MRIAHILVLAALACGGLRSDHASAALVVGDIVVLTDTIGSNYAAVDPNAGEVTSTYGGESSRGLRYIQAPELPAGIALQLRTFREIGAAATALTAPDPGWRFDQTRTKFFDFYSSPSVALADLTDDGLNKFSGDLGHIVLRENDGNPTAIPSLPVPWLPESGRKIAHELTYDLYAGRDAMDEPLRLTSGQGVWLAWGMSGASGGSEFVTLTTKLAGLKDVVVSSHFGLGSHQDDFSDVAEFAYGVSSTIDRGAIYVDAQVVAIPEPAPAVLGLVTIGHVLRRRRNE